MCSNAGQFILYEIQEQVYYPPLVDFLKVIIFFLIINRVHHYAINITLWTIYNLSKSTSIIYGNKMKN